MTNDNFYKVMDILKNYTNPNGFNFHPEHDELYIAINKNNIKKEDLKKLQDLGVCDSHNNDNTLMIYLS